MLNYLLLDHLGDKGPLFFSFGRWENIHDRRVGYKRDMVVTIA